MSVKCFCFYPKYRKKRPGNGYRNVCNYNNAYTTANEFIAEIIDIKVEHSKCLGFALTEKRRLYL